MCIINCSCVGGIQCTPLEEPEQLLLIGKAQGSCPRAHNSALLAVPALHIQNYLPENVTDVKSFWDRPEGGTLCTGHWIVSWEFINP